MEVPRNRLAAAALEALALFLPVQCAGCDEPGTAVCERCAGDLGGPVLRRDLGAGFVVWAGAEYTGTVRRALLALKNEQRTDAARALSGLLVAAIGAALDERPVPSPGPITLAALPSTRAAYRRRGYRPIDVLVRPTGIRLEHPFAWQRQPVDQIGLGRDARQANLAGSMRARRAAAGRRFLLVDDVVTTGGTLREAHRALTATGAEVLGAAVVAATPRRILASPAASHFAQ